jgi:hypothetical protein
LSWKGFCQKLYLQIACKSEIETKKIDSVGYLKLHKSQKSIVDEVHLVADKFIKLGYLDFMIDEQIKINDSSFNYKMNLGDQIKFIHIYIGKKNLTPTLSKGGGVEKDTIIIPYIKVEAFLELKLRDLEKQGFALSKLKLNTIQRKNDYLEADLDIIQDKKRGLNDIVINGYDKFPKGFKLDLVKKYRNETFNKENIKNVQADFNKIRFVRQTKSPEILFTTDSTKVFVYLEKLQHNTFDGFIGFTNDDNNNLIFNGYVDLKLHNILNAGEKMGLDWKSDGKNQKTFNLETEIPYIFKTPISIKAQLNIFKQDSIFQNTKTNLALGYNLNFNSKIYLGYQETESNAINNTKRTYLTDYKNVFTTSSFEFEKFDADDTLFPETTKLLFKIGAGNRSSEKQYIATLEWGHHYYLNQKNAFLIKSQNYYLKSSTYLTNELFRFGGINSIRGFNENGLQGNVIGSILTEYQYLISNNLYFHTVLDYGYIEDKTTNNANRLLGLGFGFGLQTKNGLFHFIYSNGSTDNQAVKLSNSIVQISLKTIF